MSATTHDPRMIITPDAFEVSSELLGLPLASPGKRLVALTIDGIVIGLVTILTSSFALVLGAVAAIFFMRAGFKRTDVKGSVFGRAMRLSVGCFGLFIGVVTAILWVAFGVDFGGSDGDARSGVVIDAAGSLITGTTGLDLVGSLGAARELSGAGSEEEAEAAARDLARRATALGLPPEAIRDLLRDLAPDDTGWDEDVDDVFARVLADLDPEAEAEADADADGDVAMLTTPEAMEAYALLLRAGVEDEADTARVEALRGRLLDEVAGDTLGYLADHIADLEELNDRQESQIGGLRDELREATRPGLFATLRDFVDELGFGFGWASLYLTVVLSWWNGQTVGKRIMGIRVLRLDGEPITWWVAFERAGGYAAGLATGLLGFAQVYWDSNRQAIHDHIVGTVVVVEGAEKVLDWEEAT